MDVARVIALAREQDVRFEVEDGELFIDSGEVPSPETLDLLRPHKAALIAYLSRQARLYLDFETASLVDLRKAGADAYAEHPSTLVLLLCYAIGEGPVRTWRPGQPMPDDLRQAIAAGMTPVAHNASFDAAIWERHLVPWGWAALPWERWSDTSARARHARYPGDLDGAAAALQIDQRKDKEGAALMRRLAKTAFMGGYVPTAAELDRLEQYCIQDIEVLREIDRRVPELSAEDTEVAAMDRAMNARGMPVDVDAVPKLIEVRDREDERLEAEVARLTGGVVTSLNQTQRILAFLTTQGVALPNIQGKTVEDWEEANAGRDDLPAQVIRLRAEAAHSAGAKLDSLLAAAEGTGRVRGSFLLHGAHTGRWSGRGAQLQNLPRSTLADTEASLRRLIAGEPEPADSPDAGLSIKALIAGVLRGLFRAPAGEAFVAADLSQIESRVLCWLAGQEDKLALYRDGQDVYLPTARSLGSDDRNLGKLLVLSAGFGASARVLIAKAPGYGVTITEADATSYIATWRADNPRIVELWHALDNAFRYAVESPLGASPIEVAGKISVWREQDATRIKLPGGRDLIYRNARLAESDRGFSKPEIHADMPNQKGPMTRLWYGTLVENVVQAIARDVLVHGMISLHRENVPLVATVHDEIVALVPKAESARVLGRMESAMTATPAWAVGLPLAAEGYVNDRFVKPPKANGADKVNDTFEEVLASKRKTEPPAPHNRDPAATAHAMSMAWPDRIENYRQKIGTPHLSYEDGWCTGVWVMGNSYGKKTDYYGAYQGNFLKRIDALFPDRGRVLHLFSGKVDLSAFPGDTLDISPELKPTYCCNAETCEGVPLTDYDFVLGDPPYSESDAEHYGTPMVNRNKVIRTLSAGLRPGARIVWLDQVYPMYSKTLLKPEALIGVSGSTNHRFRVLTVFWRISGAEEGSQTTT